ncbi:MAG: sulfotransferase, partial [Pseudomonadota bacterium]
MTDTSSASVLAEIQQAIAGHRFSEARNKLKPLLEAGIVNGQALYMAAVCSRRLGDFAQAQDFLNRLKDEPHDTGRTFQEQGHLDLTRGRITQALAAYANATELNPALVVSWERQEQIFRQLNRPEEARQAREQARRLQALPSTLLAVTDLLAQSKLHRAEALCRQFLRTNPTHVEAIRLLASIATQFGELDDSDYLLESASEFEPSNMQVRIDRIDVLRRQQRFADAHVLAKAVYDAAPENLQFKSLYAIDAMQLGHFETAIALFDQILDSLPQDAVTLTSRGHALKTLGKQDRAIESYRQAIDANPWQGDAYYALSNLKTYRFSPGEVAAMQRLEQREELAPASRVHICFALAKAFEDAAEYEKSFDCYSRGNHLKRRLSNYDAEQMSEELAAQREFFTADLFQHLQPCGYEGPDPIFIVGLPRAGSTLLEQILSSHSQVEGTLELPNIPSMAQGLRRRARNEGTLSYPQLIEKLSGPELRALGEQYLENTNVHRHGLPFFIDKMPNNFRHIGLIKLILPQARIIDARRHPLACCFSGFRAGR